MDSLNNFIPTQCIINNKLIESIANLSKITDDMSKRVKKSNRLSKGCAFLSIMAVALMFVDLKKERNETEQRISELEEKIRDLEGGE